MIGQLRTHCSSVRSCLVLPAVLAVLIASACSPRTGSETLPSSGATGDGPATDGNIEASVAEVPTTDVDVGDLSPARVDQALSAYVECMRPKLDGWVRFSMDPHLGMPMFVTLEGPRPEDSLEAAQQAESVANTCAQTSGIEALSIELQRTQPATPEQLQSIADSVAACFDVGGVGQNLAQNLRTRDIGSGDELRRAVDDAIGELMAQKPSQGASQEIIDCADTAMFGEKTEF